LQGRLVFKPKTGGGAIHQEPQGLQASPPVLGGASRVMRGSTSTVPAPGQGGAWRAGLSWLRLHHRHRMGFDGAYAAQPSQENANQWFDIRPIH